MARVSNAERTITHRTTSRESFAPCVLLTVRRVTEEPRFFRALDELLGLGGVA